MVLEVLVSDFQYFHCETSHFCFLTFCDINLSNAGNTGNIPSASSEFLVAIPSYPLSMATTHHLPNIGDTNRGSRVVVVVRGGGGDDGGEGGRGGSEVGMVVLLWW